MYSLTTTIVIITVITSIIAWNKNDLFEKFLFNPYLVYHYKEYWRIVTCTLLHADYLHLAFNMITLYSLGSAVEGIYTQISPEYSRLLYLGLYIFGSLISSIPDLIKKRDDRYFRSVGASGAVSAVIFSFIVFSPFSKLTFFIIPMPAVLTGVLFVAIEYYLSKRQGLTNINHFAHLGGAVGGIIYTIIVYPQAGINFLNSLFALF